MSKLFRKLPLLAKLMLIGLVPLSFLIIVTLQLYKEKSQTLKTIENFRQHLDETAKIASLIDNLQEERKFSFDYTMTGGMKKELLSQRPRTDSLINALTSSNNEDLYHFTEYTKLDKLAEIRAGIDSGKRDPNAVMHFYSNGIFRLNTLNAVPGVSNIYVQSLHKDLVSQKLLSEMITYLGIIRSNIYNVLYTRKYMVETMFGTLGTYDVLKSYEQEFLIKATPEQAKQYKDIKSGTQLKPTFNYIDTLFKKFSFDSTYDAKTWWTVSDAGTNELRNFQKRIWVDVDAKMDRIHENEKRSKRLTVFFLLIAILLVSIVIIYTVRVISRTLNELRKAIEKIARGETGVKVHVESGDVIGNLSQSILNIDASNKALALAAEAIGKGNYTVSVHPRSKYDLLSNAIVQMKEDLRAYSEQMEWLVREKTEELQRSNEDLQQFAHVASHDLKEPLRKIRTFSDRLSTELQTGSSDKAMDYLQKIQQASGRMTLLIEGILDYSVLNVDDATFEIVDLNDIINGITNDLEIVIHQKNAAIVSTGLPNIHGISILIQQLFYNLIYNSLKFAKEDVPPVIQLRSKKPSQADLVKIRNADTVADFIEIVIEDNGIGFDQSVSEKMFAVFTRLNSRDKYEGTGLGLALCRKIVQRHNGLIYAEGEEGQGARFHIILPV